MSANTIEKFRQGIALDAIQAVGHGLGIHTTRPSIKKNVAKKVQLVDELLQVAFGPKSTSVAKNKRLIELGGLGVIAGYSLYKGVKRHKLTLIAEGIFLGATLAAVALSSSKWLRPSRQARLSSRLSSKQFIFDIETENGPKNIKIHQTGNSFSVVVDGKKAGMLWRDVNKNPSWNASNQLLKPYMRQIISKLLDSRV